MTQGNKLAMPSIELDLYECEQRIQTCKNTIKEFINYKRAWWNPFKFFLWTRHEIFEWIRKYRILLRFNRIIRRSLLKQLTLN